jgi:hypothetical protein
MLLSSGFVFASYDRADNGVKIMSEDEYTDMSIDYYYHPQCGHCQRIEPFIQNLINSHDDIIWKLYDTSQQNYEVKSTPTIKLKTAYGKELTLTGSYEIPRYLECEINEQSNLNCPTYSADMCTANSWFPRD